VNIIQGIGNIGYKVEFPMKKNLQLGFIDLKKYCKTNKYNRVLVVKLYIITYSIAFQGKIKSTEVEVKALLGGWIQGTEKPLNQ
jgi:hypothetical protein